MRLGLPIFCDLIAQSVGPTHGLRNEMSKLSALKKFLWLGLFFVILKQGVTLLEVLAQEKCNMKSGSAPPSQATLLTWMVRTSISS